MSDIFKTKLEENVMCSICLERYKRPLTLSPCLHSYCRTCLVVYIAKFSSKSSSTTAMVISCPECRTEITLPPTGIDGLTHNHTLQNIVDNLELHDERKTGTKPNPWPPKGEEEQLKNKEILKVEEKEDEETGVAAATGSSFSTDHNDKTETNDNINNNNGLNTQNILVEEKGPNPPIVGDTSCSSPIDDNNKEVYKPPRPPRPPPPKLPKSPATNTNTNTMLYPDITDEKANLQMELDAAERPMDFDPCKDGLLMKFGKYGVGVNDLRKPYGLAVGSQGDVYISDLAGSRILHYSATGMLLHKIVTDCDAHDIALFPNGLLLVTTSKAGNAILRVYNLNGTILGEYSGLHFNYAKPSGVAIGVDNYAVVTSLENNCVYVFTEQGKLSKSFGWKGAGNERFNAPAFVTTNNKNYIIVSDMCNHSLKVFTMDGMFKYNFGQKGKDVGMLMSPMGVCTDNDNNVIVADAGNFRVQAFSSRGRPLGCPLVDTFKIGANVRPINVSMDHHHNIVVLLLGTQFAEVRTYLWIPPPPESLQDSFLKFTGSSISKMFGNIAGSF